MRNCSFILAIFLAVALPVQAQQTVEDPWEGFNRAIFQFNETADRWVLAPLAKGYRKVTPEPVEKALSQFFDNLDEVNNTAHHLLQGKPASSVRSGGRFLINTTLGIGGFLDIADEMGIAAEDSEDLGQTLAVWGVDAGPYLMLPFMGPSTLRDGPSRWFNRYLEPQTYIEDSVTRYTLRGLDLLVTRAELLGTTEQAAAQRDPYAFIRDVWWQRRQHLIHDGQVEDDFSQGDFLEE